MPNVSVVESSSKIPASVTATDRPVTSSDLKSLPKKLGQLCKLADFEAKVGQTLNVASSDGSSIQVLVGLGKKSEISVETIRSAAASFAKAASSHKAIASSLAEVGENVDPLEAVTAVVEGMALVGYNFASHKGTSSVKKGPGRLVVVSKAKDAKKRAKLAAQIVDAVNLARDLGNEPGGSLTPETFADKAKEVAQASKLKVTVWDKKRIVKEALGGVLAVNQGSVHEPRVVKLSYKPVGASAHVVLVGKGITFDSGGLSLKSSKGMMDMKIDMAGGAAVLAVMSVLAAADVAIEVTGIVPLTDNMTGGAAQRPGDVFTARNGKTVEVLNTDAEGRLILADGLSLAAEMKPDAIIDIATLTGAASVALGSKYAALMGTADELTSRLEVASKTTGENIWPLPLPKQYRSQLDSFVADIKNIGASSYGGTMVAGLFLKEFTDDVPWAHIDLGMSAFSESDSELGPKGATGMGVRLLIEALSSW